jgi:hypothetical protein
MEGHWDRDTDAGCRGSATRVGCGDDQITDRLIGDMVGDGGKTWSRMSSIMSSVVRDRKNCRQNSDCSRRPTFFAAWNHPFPQHNYQDAASKVGKRGLEVGHGRLGARSGQGTENDEGRTQQCGV